MSTQLGVSGFAERKLKPWLTSLTTEETNSLRLDDRIDVSEFNIIYDSLPKWSQSGRIDWSGYEHSRINLENASGDKLLNWISDRISPLSGRSYLILNQYINGIGMDPKILLTNPEIMNVTHGSPSYVLFADEAGKINYNKILEYDGIKFFTLGEF